MAAALEIVRSVSPGTELALVSSNDYLSKAMTKKLSKWEVEGWVGVRHRKILKCLAAELKARRAKTTFVVAAQGSDAQRMCREAMGRAKLEARRGRTCKIALDIPPGTALTGIRLQGTRQKIFYRGIREMKVQALETRPSSKKKLTEVKISLRRLRDRLVTDEEIWRSLRDKAFAPRVAQFLWKSMHNAHRIGHYWTHIPECEDRAICQTCGEEENLEHILLKCESPGRDIIWKAAEKLWRTKEPEWPELSLGGILGCGLVAVGFRDAAGKPDKGLRRLYKILVSESAYTIWKIRNDRVISRSGEPLDESAIINKWVFNLNQRLQLDNVLARWPFDSNRPRLAPSLVRDTWSGILDDEEKLPEDWLKGSRVLVGSKALTHSQLRNRGVG
ncbi:hypothetical protein K438DRAFT_1602199 [Mycena galopus ATCC 62051]|nr:hypothetical protein K438DRAFT_1602199 [Mycena galopus ATCC 62051]